MKIKLLTLFVFICILFSLCGCERGLPYEKDEKLFGTHTAAITIKDYGEIKIELYGDIAPVTVANFVKLVNNGFYDDLTFHRAIEGYMIQGGDPNGDGTGNSATRIYGEFESNGFENKLSHKKGVISMARARDYNSASCQFFIMVGDEAQLDGDYAAFGKVIEGMDIIESIVASIKTNDINGLIPEEQQPVIEKIEIINTTEIN